MASTERVVVQLSKAANRAKNKWNSENYTQIKAYVNPEIATAFKAACVDAGISVNSVLSQYMANYCDMQTSHKPTLTADFLSTKRNRRKKHEELLRQYIQLRDAQERANDNVHENFRETEKFEISSEIVSMMDEAIEILERIY